MLHLHSTQLNALNGSALHAKNSNFAEWWTALFPIYDVQWKWVIHRSNRPYRNASEKFRSQHKKLRNYHLKIWNPGDFWKMEKYGNIRIIISPQWPSFRNALVPWVLHLVRFINLNYLSGLYHLYSLCRL